MRLLSVMLLLALATVASASLLEMTQELWSRVLNGGYRRVGRLDPLQVPVIKVDQSEGNTSYRAILRNLEIGGLNDSKIESVKLVRGRLKSNLRDGEAGYVSYNEQRDLDSIRYRFHTLVKERKGSQASASNQFERIVEYDPAAMRARDEEELLRSAPLDQQRYYANEERRRSRIGEQQQQRQFNGSSQVYSGDMHVAVKPTPRNPASVRVVYTHNYRSQDGQVRPCVGACKPNQDTTGRVETRRGQAQQRPFPAQQNTRTQTRVYQEQRYSSDRGSESPASGFAIGVSNGQNQDRFSVNGGSNSGINYSANYRNGQFTAEGQSSYPSDAGASRPNQFRAQGASNSGINYSANHRSGQFSGEGQSTYPSDSDAPRPGQFETQSGSKSGTSFSAGYRSGQLSVEGQSGYPSNPTAPRPNQFVAQGGSNSGASYSTNYRSGQFSAEGQSGNPSRPSDSRPAQFAATKSGNNAGTSYSFRSDQFSAEGQTGPAQGPTQFSLKGGNQGVGYSGNYRSGQLSVESNGGEFYGPNGQRQNQFVANGGSSYKSPVAEVQGSASGNFEAKVQYGGARFSAENSGVKGGNSFSGNFRSGQLNAEAKTESESEIKPEKEESNKNFEPMTYFEDPSGEPGVMIDEYGYLCNPEEEHKPTRFQAALRSGSSEQTTQSNVEELNPYKSPMIRLEKQPGYVDIVYASRSQQGSQSRSANLKAAPTGDPRVFGLEQLAKEINGNQRYIIHNFTEGESLRQRNDAARVASESQRIKDLLRYAKEYQEKQGFYEEGMEFIYHFGNTSTRAVNDSVARRKRQHSNDKDEDDVMHVIVRMQVPALSVKADYALMGKVGRQLLRGNGRLDGNFVNVTADFMVELKKVNNSTMIVRAARAKLVSKDQDVKLQNMDQKGPVVDILRNSMMAAEAVAAMIADDLATKAISEGDNEGTVFKMYKNLPVIEKS